MLTNELLLYILYILYILYNKGFVMDKKCSKCNELKDIFEFRFCDRTAEGKGEYYASECRECERRYKRTPRAKIKRYTQLDSEKGLKTDIDEQWYIDNIQNELCSYCLLPSNSMVADRIDNLIGHIKDNCIPACPLCNRTRMNDYSVDEMKLLGSVIRDIKLKR